MILYFDFEDRRTHANVSWPKNSEPVIVHLTDAKLTNDFPSDLYFEVERGNKVSFIIEDRDNKRLLELQNVLARRLQEFVNKP